LQKSFHLSNPNEKLFLKISNASKKIKNAKHSRHSMTHKLNIDNGLQGRWQKTLAITAPTQNAGFRVPKTVLCLIKH
jgi:hypothetical protein